MTTSIGIRAAKPLSLAPYSPYEGRGIPPSLLNTLKMILPQRTISPTLLIRHAPRPPIPHTGEDCVLLTEEGKEAARFLGTLLATRNPHKLISSTKERCVQTLDGFCEGAGWIGAKVEQNPLFTPSGPFTIDETKSHAEFLRIGGPALFNTQITEEIPPPGMSSTREGVNEVLKIIFDQRLNPGELSIIVTHDSVTAIVHRIFI